MNKVRLLILGGAAGAHKGLLMSLAAEPDFEIVGETGGCEEALKMITALNPDVIVIDLDMPGGRGLALAEKARMTAPRTAMIVLSLQDDLFTAAQARKAGATVLVAKTLPAATLFSTIRSLAI